METLVSFSIDVVVVLEVEEVIGFCCGDEANKDGLTAMGVMVHQLVQSLYA